MEYIDALNRKIYIDGKEANRILDIRIPEETIDYLNIGEIADYASDRNIIFRIKEF